MLTVLFRIACLSVFALGSSCGVLCTRGSGTIVTVTRQVPEFRALVVDCSVDVVAGPVAAGTLELEADDNIAPLILTRVEGGTLSIDTASNTCIEPTGVLRVRVAFGALESILIDGSGDVTCEEPLRVEKLSVAIDGSGDVVLTDLDVGELETLIDGSGDITYAGRAGHHAIEIDGSGDVLAARLATEATEIHVDGSGDCTVAVASDLSVKIDGSGDVSYSGEPAKTSLDVDGSGTLRKVPAR